MIAVRLLSVQPQTDGEHWKLTGHLHNDDWHLDAYGQNPTPYYRNPSLGPPNRIPFPWRPGQVAWGASDPVFPGKMSFNLVVNTAVSPTSLDISGAVPVNVASTTYPGSLVRPPIVPLVATTANTGGHILPGNYLIAIGGGKAGPVSQLIQAVVPAGTSTNTITVSGVVWSGAAPAIIPYVGLTSLSMYEAGITSYGGSSNDGFGNPTVFTFTRISTDGKGMPDQAFNSFLLEAYDIIHGGVWGDAIGSVNAGFNILTFPAASWTTNQWAGYTLALYYHPGTGAQVALNMTVASNTATTLTLTAPASVAAGDVVVMRFKPATFTSNSIDDPSIINSYSPSGMTVNASAGNLLWTIAGTGAGTPPVTIASNTTTGRTVQGAFYVTPDATSVFIETAPSPRYMQATGATISDGTTSPVAAGSILATNKAASALWVGAITVDSQGNWSPERYAPFREVFVPEQITQVNVSTTPYSIDPQAQVITFLNGSSVANLPPLASIIRHAVTLINATTATTLTINPAGSDTTAGASSVTMLPGTSLQLMPNA